MIGRKCARFNSKCVLIMFDCCMMDKTKFLIHLIVILQIAFIIVSLTLHDSYYSVSFAYFSNNTSYDNGTSQVGSVNDTNGSSNITKSVTISSQNVKIPTDGGSVDVLLQPSPFPLTIGDSKFKISFFQPSSETIQVHVDYDVVIKHSNTEIFRASALTGQPLLHTAEGIVTIPFKFNSSGNYTLEVAVMGINFVPIRTEYASFDFNVK
jgi:hypothetical protein